MFLSTLAFLFLTFLGVFLFSWTLWIKLKEDYLGDHIFTLTLGILGGVLVGFWLAPGFGFSLWFPFVAGLLVSLYLMRKFSFRFFETVDALAPAWFWLVGSAFLGAFVRKVENYSYLSESLVSFVSLLLVFWFSRSYRRFRFYPSGKVGFVGFASLSVYFYLRSLVAMVLPFVLSFSQNLADSVTSFLLASFLLITLYVRSGRGKAQAVEEEIVSLAEKVTRGIKA